MNSPFSAADPLPAPAPRAVKARAYHWPGRMVLVALLFLLAYAGVAAFAVGLVGIAVVGGQEPGFLALAGLGVFVVGRVFAFPLSRSLNCSLCHGGLMQSRRCQKHARAFRLPLLSHRASAVISVLTTGRFRCMYCGTPYRLRR